MGSAALMYFWAKAFFFCRNDKMLLHTHFFEKSLLLIQFYSAQNLQLALPTPNNHSLIPSDPLHGITNHLINDHLGALPVVHHRGSLAHQERSCVIHGIVINIVTHALKVEFDGNVALRGQVLDFGLAVLFPVGDVGVVADAEWAAGEDDGADVVVEAGGADGFLVGAGSSGFLLREGD